MPFMPAVLPQVWPTNYADGSQPGITDTDIKQAPIPQPILFALHGLRLSQRGMFQPSKAMLPQVYQWEYADNTLYGKTDTDLKQSPIPQPLLFLLAGLLALSGKGLFHPAKSILASEGAWVDGRTDSEVDQAGILKPLIFILHDDAQMVFHPTPVQAQVPDPSMFLTIQGTTKDKTGKPVIGFTLYLFDITSGTPVFVKTTTSDGVGFYSFTVDPGKVYWIADYRTDTPDMGGVTLNTLIGGALADIFAFDPTVIPDVTPVGALLNNVSSGGQEILISAILTVSV